jgi:Glycoside hydrolase 123, catalytic domain/Glycoside hydrolase 123 N-terminal domain
MLTTTDVRYGNSLIFAGDIAMLDLATHCEGQMMNRYISRTFWFLAGLSAFPNPGILALHAQAGPTVWVVPALTRVARDEGPGNRREIELWAARGEYESFQVVVHAPPGGLKNVNVAISDLEGDRGRITRASMTLYREHYVQIMRGSPDRGGTNRPLGPGWYPDALIPFSARGGRKLRAVPFDVAQSSNQPIWIDVFVEHETLPGRYSGTVTVTSDQGKATVSLIVNVWNFELPRHPSLLSAFNVSNDANSNPKIFYGDEKQNQELLLRHKIMPVFVDPRYERQFMEQYGLSISRIEYFQHASYGNCNQPPAPSVAQLLSLKAKHQPDLTLYLHMGDEVSECPNIFPILKQWGRNARQAGLLALLTAIPLPELLDDGSGASRSVADIWVLLPKQFVSNAADVAAAMKKGDHIWSYTAIVQDNFSPKWEIDFRPINYRIYGFLNQSVGATGLLYWSVDSWAVGPTKDPWNNITYIENGKPEPPGEGWLVYPGADVGSDAFVPSMRLKWIRKSVEDFEYVEILKKLHRGDWALALVKTVATDWAHWSQDPDAVESVRHQLGVEIDRISSASKAPNGPASEKQR